MTPESGTEAHQAMTDSDTDHPEHGDASVLAAHDIQVLTDRRDHAHELSRWSTTRLDGDHVLVEA